jgi:hypothetical protein
MLFHQEDRQFLGQGRRHALALRKGHQLILVRFAEHALEGASSSLNPTLAQCLPILPAQK